MAAELGIERILCPSASGVLCALGLAAAAPRRDVSRTLMLGEDELTRERLAAEREAMLAQARAALGASVASTRVRHELRYRGQAFELVVDQSDAPDPHALREAFARAHEQRYGYRDDAAQIELVNVRVSVWGEAPRPRVRAGASAAPRAGETQIVFDGRALAATVLRGDLSPGTRVRGPALWALEQSTLLVPPGWAGEVDEHGTCVLERAP
jgi:N-methylhydantoinase A/oxoprolinase/acetone carboxylase beta subunit